MSGTPVLEVKNLTKRYPDFVLDRVDLSLDRGSIMGFVGRNGAGKTTTLKALLGIIHPDEGEIKFFGENFEGREHEVKTRVSFTMGEITFYPKKRLEVIADVYRRFFDKWDEQAYREYLDRFELVETKKVSELSSGMRVKFGLALALSHHAELVILDEPTSGLDPLSRDDLMRSLRQLVDDKGVSLLFSTHQMNDLEQVADTITYLERGKVRASEPLDTFVDRYVMVSVPSGEVPPDLDRALIGATEFHGRIEGLLERSQLDSNWNVETAVARLNDIVVHIERQENGK